MSAYCETKTAAGGKGPRPNTADLYRFSISLGARALRRGHVRAALPRLLNPLSYPRGLEYALTLRGLDLPNAGSILDIGSPKLLFLWLAAHSGLTIHSTDIQEGFIAPTRRLLTQSGLSEEIGQRLFLESEDARRLTYADNSFDAVYSISVVEHIPDDGDAAALAEIARVLRPGGRVSLTVPFAASGYREDWVCHDVYERRREEKNRPVFFQRRYDRQALEQRIIGPSGLRLLSLAYFGEPRLPFDHLWNRLPLPARLPLAWAQPLFERAFLRELPEERADRAIGVCLTLMKEGPHGS